MANELAKYINSRRRQKDDNAIAKQLRIAKQHKVSEYNPGEIKQPHRLAKHHVMDCGNPDCYMCRNPRKLSKDKLTAQEKRLFQDMDNVRDTHSNGLDPDKEQNS